MTCRANWPWDLSAPVRTNCAYDGVVMNVCANASRCPGVCVVPKGGSTAFKWYMAWELGHHGEGMRFEHDCPGRVHCSRFPWPAWPAPERVVRIVRHPAVRLLSGYLDQKHLTQLSPGLSFLQNASFETVALAIVALPDNGVNSHLRRQSAMCAAPPSAPMRVLRLEEYATWRPWLLAELGWSENALPLVPKEAQTTAERMSEFYTPSLLTRVQLWAATDMGRFGYAPYPLGPR